MSDESSVSLGVVENGQNSQSSQVNSSPRLFTIGYERTTVDVLLKKLQSEGVELVLDVREIAWSRKPGFSAKQLASALNERGIEYIHEPKLGTPRSIRQRYRVTGDASSFRDEYMEHVVTIEGLMESYADLIESKS